jgi:hypothetical protein
VYQDPVETELSPNQAAVVSSDNDIRQRLARELSDRKNALLGNPADPKPTVSEPKNKPQMVVTNSNVTKEKSRELSQEEAMKLLEEQASSNCTTCGKARSQAKALINARRARLDALEQNSTPLSRNKTRQ